ncbi:MAG: DUF3822 family protein [Candidatus Moranbacteria bacterium]|nr:DUF3822 family protein [Candidatus Moranbacteria bacterium]
MTGSFAKTYTSGGDFLEFEPEENLKLSIELSLDGFSFVVKEGNFVKAVESYSYEGKIGYAEYASNLKDIFEFLGFTGRVFKQVKVCWHSGSLVFVPKEVFDPLHKEKYYGFCESSKTNENIISDSLDEIDCFGLYEFPSEVESVIGSIFPKYQIVNSASAIIKWFFKSQYKKSDAQHIVIQIRDSGIDIFWFEGQSLLFFNSFNCRVSEDYLYFIMYFVEQFKVDSSKTKVILFGETEGKQDFLENANQLLDNVELLDGSVSEINTNIIGSNEYGRFHLLFNI